MPIKYSLTAHSSSPSDPDAKWLVYPRVQYSEVMSLDELARHVSRHSGPFSRELVVGVLTATAACVREQLLAGKKVSLGDLGDFHLSLRSDGAPTADDYDPRAHVKRIDVCWQPSPEFQHLEKSPDIKWEYTISRRSMRQLRREIKEQLDEEVALSRLTPPADGGDGAPQTNAQPDRKET